MFCSTSALGWGENEMYSLRYQQEILHTRNYFFLSNRKRAP